MKKEITVFTPTYNRADMLVKCYRSLLKQNNKNFKWQIIDDGSNDNTGQVVERWIEEKKIDIQYIYKPNGGKVSAINKSLEITKTPLWMCLDSDDYLFEDAIDIILKNYKSILHSNKICGMFALRSSADMQPMQGINIPTETKYVTQSQVRYNFKIPPEYVHIFKTDIIKNYKYPLIKGEKYLPLSYVYDQIDQKYEYKVIHDPLMVCEYQNEGMTINKRKLIKNNPKGYLLYKRQLISLAPDVKTKIKACVTYNTACILSRKYRIFYKNPAKLLTLLTLPLGFVDYVLRYKLNYQFNIEKIRF